MEETIVDFRTGSIKLATHSLLTEQTRYVILVGAFVDLVTPFIETSHCIGSVRGVSELPLALIHHVATNHVVILEDETMTILPIIQWIVLRNGQEHTRTRKLFQQVGERGRNRYQE